MRKQERERERTVSISHIESIIMVGQSNIMSNFLLVVVFQGSSRVLKYVQIFPKPNFSFSMKSIECIKYIFLSSKISSLEHLF
jgi:hypothetical protein